MTKELFLDSANSDDIIKCLELGLVTGITTNPSLMAKEEKPVGLDTPESKFEYYAMQCSNITSLIHNRSDKRIHLSVEVLSLEPNKMVEQAKKLRKYCSDDKVDLHVKIPFVLGSIPCLSELKAFQVKVNLTALMSAKQGYMAEKYRPEVVSFFFNRMIDGNIEEAKKDAEKAVTDYHQDQDDKLIALNARLNAKKEITKYIHSYKLRYDQFTSSKTFVIAGSIRTTKDVEDLWFCGVDAVTAPMHVVEDMMHHRKTYEAVEKFSKDIENWFGV
jgi:transaldolase